MNRAGAALSLVFCGVLTSGIARADLALTFVPVFSPVPLSRSGSETVNGVTFSNLSFTPTCTKSSSSGICNVSGAVVTIGYDSITGDAELEISDQTAFTASATVPAKGAAATTSLIGDFSYLVTTAGPTLSLGGQDTGTCAINNLAVGDSCTVQDVVTGPNGSTYTLSGANGSGLIVNNGSSVSGGPTSYFVHNAVTLIANANSNTTTGSKAEAELGNLFEFVVVPEPASYAFLLGVGMLVGFYFLRRKAQVS